MCVQYVRKTFSFYVFEISIDVANREILNIFQYEKKTNIEELNNNCLREKLWKKLFYYLTDHTHVDCHQHCLAALRILR